MNYLEQFGLAAEPFSNSLSTRVFYKSASHGKALLRLMTAADAEGGVFSLLGAHGTGKSLLLRRLLETLSEESTRAALVPVPRGGLTEADLAKALSFQLRLEPAAASIKALGKAVEAANDGRRVLIIIDDADRLDPAVFKTLTGMKSASRVYTGPTSASFAAGDSLVITPLNGDGTDAFIRLRLKMAGRVHELLTPDARQRVHQISLGIPSRINSICEQALMSSALAGADEVNEAAILIAGLIAGCADAQGTPREPILAPALVSAKRQGTATGVTDDDVLSRLAGDEAASLQDDFTADAASDKITTSANADDSGDELGSMLADLTSDEAPQPKPAAAKKAKPAPDPVDDDLDSMLNDLAADDEPASAPVAVKKAKPAPTSAPPDDELDSMLNDLAADDAPAPASVAATHAKTAVASSVDDDLDSMLNDLASDDEPAPKPVAAKKAKPAPAPPPVDDELDSMLNDLAADEEPAPAPVAAKKSKPAPALSADDDLDSMLNDLGADDEPAPAPVAAKKAKPAPAPSVDDDLDSMLNDLAAEDEPSPAPVASKKSKAAPARKAAADDDLDAMLSGMDNGEPETDMSGESLDDMLGSLDQEMSAKSAADDDLDSLLSGLDDDVPLAQPIKKATTQAKAAPAKKPVPVPDPGDDLDDMLGSLEMETDTKSKRSDSLENELDSLLEGLDD